MATQSAPETLTELKITDAIREKIEQAYVPNDWPLVVAHVDEQGLPSMSYRGSVVVVSDTQLGFWARNAEGSTATSLSKNPNLQLIYREPAPDHGRSVALIRFRGKGRVERSGAIYEQVWETMPERERDADAEKKGAAIIVDLESVFGMISGYLLKMTK